FYRCNMWHVRGRDRDLLVDSGMGVVSLRRQVAILAERPVLAVASHTHFDHIGTHHEFADRAVHRAEAGILAKPTRSATRADVYVKDATDSEMFTMLPPGAAGARRPWGPFPELRARALHRVDRRLSRIEAPAVRRGPGSV